MQPLSTLLELQLAILEAMKDKENSHIKGFENILSFYCGEDWKAFCEFSNEKYTRIPIYQNLKFEIILMCWNPGQYSSLHDHPPNGCMMKIIQGSLVEKRYKIKPLQFMQINTLKENTVYYIGHNYGHAVYNATDDRCVSLHIYSPPNYIPRYLDTSNCENFENAEIDFISDTE